MRVLNEEVVSESGSGSTMESESDKMLGSNSIYFDLRLFFCVLDFKAIFCQERFPSPNRLYTGNRL